MAWAWPNRQRTPLGILSTPTHLPIVTAEMRSSGVEQSVPFSEARLDLAVGQRSKGISIRGHWKEKEFEFGWIFLSLSNGLSEMSESEQLRGGRSSNVALGKSRKRRQDRCFNGKEARHLR